MFAIRVLRTHKDLLAVTLSGVVGVAFLAVFWFAGAYLTSKDVFGEITLVISLGSMASAFAVFGFGMTIHAIAPRDDSQMVAPTFSAIALAASLIIGLVTGILLDSWLEYLVIVLGQTSFAMTAYSKLAAKEYINFSIWNVSCGGLMLTFGLTGIIYQLIPIHIAVIYALPPLLLGGTFFRHSYNGIKARDWHLLRTHFGSTIMLGGYALLRSSVSYLDKIVIGLWLGLLVLGEYQFIFQVFLVLQFLPVAARNYLIPEAATNSVSRRTVMLILVLSVFLVVAAAVGVPPLVQMVLPQYSNTVSTILVVIISVPFSTLASIYVSRLLALDRMNWLLLSYAASLIVQYSVIVGFAALSGIFGLGVAILGGQLVLALIAHFGQRGSLSTYSNLTHDES